MGLTVIFKKDKRKKKETDFRKYKEQSSSRFEVSPLQIAIVMINHPQPFCAVLLMVPIPGREYLLGLTYDCFQ